MPLSFPRNLPLLPTVLAEARGHEVSGAWRVRVDLARRRLAGPPVRPEGGVDYIAGCLSKAVRDRYDAVFVIDGKEGVSKSVLALRVALRVAELTGVPWDFSHLCRTARDVVRNYRTLPRGSVVWYDEASRGLLAGDTFDPEQVVLIQTLFQARIVGIILILCIPDIQALARKVRGRRASFWAHVDKRGTPDEPAPSFARLFERDETLRFKPTSALGLWASPRCPVVRYEPFADDDPLWVTYETDKRENLGKKWDEDDEILDRHERRTYGRILTRVDPAVRAKGT